jgi:hypothetical protein
VNDLLVRGQRGLEAAAIVAFVAAKRTLLRVHGTLRKSKKEAAREYGREKSVGVRFEERIEGWRQNGNSGVE